MAGHAARGWTGACTVSARRRPAPSKRRDAPEDPLHLVPHLGGGLDFGERWQGGSNKRGTDGTAAAALTRRVALIDATKTVNDQITRDLWVL